MRKKMICVLLAWTLIALCLPFSAYAEEVDSGPFLLVDAGFAGENAIHILALGEAFQKLPGTNYDTATVYYMKNGEQTPRFTRCPITWDFTQLDSSVPGLYTLDGTVELTNELMPDEGIFPDGRVTVPLSYYVYDPNSPKTKLEIQVVFLENEIRYNMNKDGDVRLLDLPDYAYGGVFVGRFKDLVECAIAWDYESFDSSAPGKQTIYGDLLPPEAFRVGEDAQTGAPLRVKCEVMVSDAEAPAQTTIIYGYGYMMNSYRLIPLGMDAAELATSFEKRLDPGLEFQFTTEDKVRFSCDYEIDTAQIDTTEIGAYYPLSLIDFPAYTIFDQPVKDTTAVYVVDPDEVDLRCVQYYPSKGELEVSWIYSVDTPTLWVSVDDGDWEPVEDVLYSVHWQPNDEGVRELVLRVRMLDPGHDYEFEVRYGNNQYSVNTLVVDLSDEMLVVYDTPIEGDRHGYDRDDGSNNTGDGDTGSNAGGTTSSPDNNSGNHDSAPKTPESDHSNGVGAQMPTDGSHDSLAQSIHIAETEPPAMGKTFVPTEDKFFAGTQADLTEQSQSSDLEHISRMPDQNTLQAPAVNAEQLELQPSTEITTARNAPVSTALPIALGSGAIACGVAFLWLRKRVKP